MRGLKDLSARLTCPQRRRPPQGGAWIEINLDSETDENLAVAPCRVNPDLLGITVVAALCVGCFLGGFFGWVMGELFFERTVPMDIISYLLKVLI